MHRERVGVPARVVPGWKQHHYLGAVGGRSVCKQRKIPVVYLHDLLLILNFPGHLVGDFTLSVLRDKLRSCALLKAVLTGKCRHFSPPRHVPSGLLRCFSAFSPSMLVDLPRMCLFFFYTVDVINIVRG